MQAQGSQLTNKYAEGYPGKRYYGGCEFVDKVEQLAIDRACELFGATYANVQPHAGSQANSAVFQALVSPGDTILGMSLDAGGHLTHGARPNFSGKHYNAVQYGLGENGLIDYAEVARLAREHKPKMIIAGFSAYSQIIDWAEFRKIADEVGAYLLVDMAHVAGLVAAGVYPSPLPHAHVVTTTTHKTLRGPRGGLILSAEGNADIEKKLNSAVFPGGQGGPLMHVIAAKAICFKEAMDPSFKTYQQQVVKNAQAMASVFLERGFEVVSGGTEDHLFLLSLVKQGLTGKDADAALGRAHITVNKNAVPGDPQSPFVTSGLRIGTPAVTTRGFKEQECLDLAGWICDILEAMVAGDSAAAEAEVQAKVSEVCARLPVYA
jgi:glycine hydroxymethyltransferase